MILHQRIHGHLEWLTCPKCGGEAIAKTLKAHTYVDGVCSQCGYAKSESGTTECSHTYVMKSDETYHWNECSKCGKKETSEEHKGGLHSNGGACTVCGKQYLNHTANTSDVVGYSNSGTKHELIYGCSYSGCEGTFFSGVYENCSGGTHANGGVCEKCGVKYQDHVATTKVIGYTNVGADGHIYWFECEICGNSQAIKGTITFPHNYENGECTACKYKHTDHSFEDGICTVCGAAKSTGDGNESSSGGNSGNTGTGSGSSGNTGTGSGSGENTGNTGDGGSGGTVTDDKCSHTYEVKSDETYHWEECTKCNEIKENSKEKHKGGNHEEGKCSVCEYVYQKHGKSTDVKEYKKTETGHIAIYKCTEPTCTETYEEEKEEEHKIEKWTDNNNGTHTGVCSVCKAEVLEEHTYKDGKCSKCNCEEKQKDEECTHTYEWKNNNSQHWEECSKCGKVKSGSLVGHIYNSYTDNLDGTHTTCCTVCKYKLTEAHKYENNKCTKCNAEKEEEACEHDYKEKNDKEYHWEECSKCGTIKENSKEKHKFDKAIENGDGMHSSTCSECKYQLIESHDYEEGLCVDCGAKQDNSDEGNGDNSNDDDGKGNNSNNNNNNDGNDNDSSKKDDTLTDKDIPYTGWKNTTIILIVVLCVGIVLTVFKIRKYKDI